MRKIVLKRLAIIAGCIFIFFSCKKEKDNKIIAANLRVKTVTNGNSVMSYSYDDKKRMVKSESDVGFFKDEFLYEGTTITRTISEPSNTVSIRYSLDANGYLTSSRYTNSQDVSFYEHTSDGTLIRSYDDDVPAFEARYYYNANTGLLDSMRATKGTVWVYTNLFSFYADRINTIDNENFGQMFWGSFSPHPTKSVVTRRPDGNVINVTFTNYTYTYNEEGIITSRSFSTSGGQSGTESYTYY